MINENHRSKKNYKIAYIISIVVGASVWIGVSLFSGKSEAWDSSVYWLGVLFIYVICGLLGFYFSEQNWRWAAILFGTQALIAFVQNPNGNLLPLGLLVFGVIAIPGILSGILGAYVQRKQAKNAH